MPLDVHIGRHGSTPRRPPAGSAWIQPKDYVTVVDRQQRARQTSRATGSLSAPTRSAPEATNKIFGCAVTDQPELIGNGWQLEPGTGRKAVSGIGKWVTWGSASTLPRCALVPPHLRRRLHGVRRPQSAGPAGTATDTAARLQPSRHPSRRTDAARRLGHRHTLVDIDVNERVPRL